MFCVFYHNKNLKKKFSLKKILFISECSQDVPSARCLWPACPASPVSAVWGGRRAASAAGHLQSRLLGLQPERLRPLSVDSPSCFVAGNFVAWFLEISP